MRKSRMEERDKLEARKTLLEKIRKGNQNLFTERKTQMNKLVIKQKLPLEGKSDMNRNLKRKQSYSLYDSEGGVILKHDGINGQHPEAQKIPLQFHLDQKEKRNFMAVLY